MQSELLNVMLRHAVLASLYTHTTHFIRCMDRSLFGPNSPQEIALTQKLTETAQEIQNLMSVYFEQEANMVN